MTSMGFSTRLHVVTILALGCAACPSDTATNEQVCEVIGSSGGVVASHDGVLSLSFRPSAVSEDTTVCISPAERPPRGPEFVYGEAYRVTPDIDLNGNLSVNYRFDLPSNTSQTAIGVVRRADWEAGQGTWLSLPITRLEPENKLVSGIDSRLSMFYGLLDDGGDGMVDPTVASTSPTNPTTDPATTDPTTDTTQTTNDTDQTDADTNNVDTDSVSDTDTDSSGVSSSGDSDESRTMSNTDPTTSTDETTTGDTESESEAESESESESETGMNACDALPAGPITPVQFANFQGGNSEDLAMTGQGSFVVAAGDTLVEIDAEGVATPWFTPLPADEDLLGMKFDAYGTLYILGGFNDPNIYAATTGGVNVYLADAHGGGNGIFVDSANRLWITDFVDDVIYRVETGAVPTIEVAVDGNTGQANGIFYDENRGMLFWDRYNAGQVYRAPVDVMGNVGESVLVGEIEGRIDGMTMDECGNLYVVDQGGPNPCRLDRMQLDDNGDLVMLEELAGAGTMDNGCSNPMFGYGYGDDFDESVFIASNGGRVFRVPVGVAGYPITLPGK